MQQLFRLTGKLNWQPWKQQKLGGGGSLKADAAPPIEASAAAAKPCLETINNSLKQHCDRRVAKPAKPKLRNLDLEIHDLWAKGKGVNRKGRIGILASDCFLALKMHMEQQRAHRELRRAARARKREQTLSLLLGAESAAAARDSRKLFQFVRLLSPKGSSKRVHLRGAKGELLTPSQERTHLVEYARELFTGDPFDEYLLSPLPAEWFSEEAWIRSLRQLRSHKAVPLESASVVAWKENAEQVAAPLSRVATAALCGDRMKVPQKPPVKPENLRSLGLMAPDTKAFLLILREHSSPFVQARMSCFPQFAYRQGTSTYDPILRASSHCHKVRDMLEKHKGDLTSKLLNKTEQDLTGGLMCSLDLHRAFDMVSHADLYSSLIATNMPERLASILIEIHRSTVLSITHGGDTECVTMTRGLRQGCPIAPMLYSAWVCQFCDDLDKNIASGFSQQHISVFADDKHLFWEIHSTHHLRQAVRQLQLTIELLEKRGMQVSFQKSAVVYALRGRYAEEMVGRFTTWFRGERHFVLRGQSKFYKLPVKDRLQYLGVVLSYGSFEMQTAVHRADKACQSYGMLTKTLRTKGALSLSIRLRIYNACVWSSIVYGQVAVGFTAGSLQHVISIVSQHLRKVMRIYEKGVTNNKVLEAAGLDVISQLKRQSRSVVDSVQTRVDNSQFGAVELGRAKSILTQLETFEAQDSHGSIQAVVPEQVPRVECPMCGLEFAGEFGLQMHIKAKHPSLNQTSKIDFVRSKHSLFGAPFCRFCHVRCYNWQALEKHVAEGGCPRIKDSLARGVPIDCLFEKILEEEREHPPVPPAAELVHEVAMIDSGHPILTCALHEVPRHVVDAQKLRLKCGLCGQLVREANTMKTHWRATHPQAWQLVWQGAASEAKSMSAIFVTPCSFCGLVNKNPNQHAVRCPTFFQISALRKITRDNADRNNIEGSKQCRPRQHERTPAYKSWRIDQTSLGKAFKLPIATGISETKDAADNAQERTSSEAATVETQRRSTTTPQQGYDKGLHRFFRKSSESSVDRTHSRETAPMHGDPWTCCVRLRNPHSLC